MFIARKGSWNRTKPIGFDVVNVRVGEDGKASSTPFLTGFQEGGDSYKFWGRPAYVAQMPDGALLVSDEQIGAIYRISYQRPKAPAKKQVVLSVLRKGRWAFLLTALFSFPSAAGQERVQLCAACHGAGRQLDRPAGPVDRRAAEAVHREPAGPVPRGAAQVRADAAGGEGHEGRGDRRSSPSTSRSCRRRAWRAGRRHERW